MRKILIIVLALATLLSLLGGCGKELEPIEKAQAKAVEIGEQYLDFEITGKEARALLNDIKVPETEGNGQIYLKGDISALAFYIGKNDSTYDEVKKRVESIAEYDYTD